MKEGIFKMKNLLQKWNSLSLIVRILIGLIIGAILGVAAPKAVTGQILSCNKVSDYNDFAHPDVVKPAVFKDAKVKKNTLKVKIPAKSIVVLKIK